MSAARGVRLFLVCLSAMSVLAGVAVERLNAQVLYGSVVGTVTDQSGAVVPKAHIVITNTATGVKRETVADDTGHYSIPDVPPGAYDLAVSASGFRPLTKTNLEVTVNTVTDVDAQLQVGAVSQEVTVQADVAALQTEKTDVHTELSATAVQNLPLNQYRNFQSLINLVPGATSGAQAQGFQNAIADSPERALSFNINGTNRNNNNTRVDGATDVFVWLPHHAVYIPPAETVQEVNVTTGSFDAEQGMAGGAAVTVVTKSGTNQLHGVGFLYHQDNALRARQFFESTPQKGKSILNDAGGTLGGPIRKLFFFFSWDGTFERDNRGLLQTVPTADIQAGDFTKTSTTIYDPSTGNSDGTGRQPFANQAAIPIDPVAAKILNSVPRPNRPGYTSNYFASATQRLNRNNFDGKIDWNRNDRHRIWGKYSAMRSLFHGVPSMGEAIGDCLCDGGLGSFHDLVNLVTVGHTLTISPSFIIDGTVGFTRMTEFGQPPDFGKNIGLEVLGIAGTNDPVDKRGSGWPYFAISGFDHLGNPENWNPAYRNDWSLTTSHNATKLHGRHEFRFGFDAVHHHLNHWQPELGAGPRGEFDFGGGATALNGGPAAPDQFNAFAQFLLGLPGELGVSTGSSVGVGKSIQFSKMTGKEWQFGWYVGDRYRITPKLTATLGLRYEYYPLMTRDGTIKFERFDFDPTADQIFLGGVGSNPTHLGVTTSKKLFAPRIGLAYQINQETVARAGFGITYDPLPLARPLRGFYPLTVGSNFVGVNGFVPFGTLSSSPPVVPVLPSGSSLAFGIPQICCPDISSGVITVPGAASVRSPGPGLLKRGYIESWNFTLERRLPGSFVTSIAYVGTQTVHQFADLNVNASLPGTGAAGQPFNIAPFNRGADTNYWQGWLNANYHSLQVAANRRFSNGLMIKGAYTYSRAIDWTDDDGWAGLTWNDPNILKRNRAEAGYNIPHIFNVAYVYELPAGKDKKWANSGGLASAILGGWQVNGMFSSFQGVPFTVTASGASLNSRFNTQTADQVKPVVKKLGGIGPGQPFYDPTAFAAVTGVRYGTSGRNLLRGPGVVNLDFGLFRHFKLTERLELQLRAEAFNFFNTPHFNNPSTGNRNRSSASFLQITSARNDERQFRFALRLAF